MTTAIESKNQDPIESHVTPLALVNDPSSVTGDDERVLVTEFDLSIGIPNLAAHDASGARLHAAEVLVRVFTEPVGVVRVGLPDTGIGARQLAADIDRQCGKRIREILAASGLTEVAELPLKGLAGVESEFLRNRHEVLSGELPKVTVVVCTRDRPLGLRRTLESLAKQEYPSIQVVVVDNAPTGTDALDVVQTMSDRLAIDYVVEPRPGLSWARNRSIEASDGEIIAWLDDDEEADSFWVVELVSAFHDHPEVGAVSGVILPAELETQAQRWFEQYGGHHKGRGFEKLTFSPATRRAQSPLYPRPPFGTGGNMAFRREVIKGIGMFDTALGACTVTMGAEDTAAFSELLYSGGTVAYRPSALIWHWHRREVSSLHRMIRGYGRGLVGFYLSFLRRHPAAFGELLHLVPQGLMDMRRGQDSNQAIAALDIPPSVLREMRRGIAEGLPMYAVAWWRSRRLEQLAAR